MDTAHDSERPPEAGPDVAPRAEVPGKRYIDRGVANQLVRLCGIFQILVGAFCLLVAYELLSAKTHEPFDFFGAALFFLMGTWLCGLALGAVAGAAWGYSLSQATAWLCFAFGVSMFVRLNLVQDANEQYGLESGDMAVAMKCGLYGFAVAVHFLLYVLVPGGLAATYTLCQPRNLGTVASGRVRAWLKDYSVAELMLAGLYGVSAAILGYYAWREIPFPFFGHLISGTAGKSAGLVVAAIMAFLSIAHGRRWKWTGFLSAVFSLAFGTSLLLTFTSATPTDLYRGMGLAQDEIDWILRTEPGNPQVVADCINTIAWMAGIWGLLALGRLTSITVNTVAAES